MKKIKTLLFSISIMLAILFLQGITTNEDFLSDAWGATCGPCESLAACGMGNETSAAGCDPVDLCSGSCSTTCAKGAYDQFCMGVGGGECTTSVSNCSPLMKYGCVSRADGTCKCYQIASSGYCIRQTC